MWHRSYTWLSGSIKRQVVLVLAFAALAYALLQGLVIRHVLLPEFQKLQRTEAREDIQRCVSVIEHEIKMTTRKAADWAAWDDTYQFVQDVNPEYAQSNLVDDAFISLQVDVMMYCDPNGRIVWGRVFDWRREVDLSLQEFSQPSLDPNHILLVHDDLDCVMEGIWSTEHLPLLLSSMPIITSERKGPIRGTLIMGTFLDPAMVQGWAADLAIDFSIRPMAKSCVPAEEHMLSDIASQGSYLDEVSNPQMIYGVGVLHDVQGKPCLWVEAKVPTDILQQGMMTLRYATLSVCVAGGLLLLAVYGTLHRTLLRRITSFSETFKEIADQRDLSLRVPVEQSDEMGLLQDGLNSMLRSLQVASSAVQESEKTYRHIFRAVHDCLCVVDDRARLVAANPATCEVFGIHEEHVIGRPMIDLVYPEDKQVFEHFFHVVKTQGKLSQTLRFVCADGHLLSVSTRGRVTRCHGQTHVLLMLRDLVERQEIESSLHAAKQEVKSASQFKSGLLRNVTHEMRTPLNRIIGFTDILEDEALNAEQQAFLQNIKQSGEELRTLINSILDVSLIEAGNIQLNVMPSTTRALIHELHTIGKNRAAKANLDFALDCAEDLPETLHTDVDRLRQCLVYLMDNAIKFTPEGRIVLRVARKEVAAESGVAFAICDTGPGIAPELQAAIFTPFAQGDGSAIRAHGGLGTGLALAKCLSELLGGSLHLDSEVGVGSTFTLIIPTAPPDPLNNDPSC